MPMNDTDRTAYWTMTGNEVMEFVSIDAEGNFGTNRSCFRCDHLLEKGDVFLPILGRTTVTVICLECILIMLDNAPIPHTAEALGLAVSGLGRIAEETG
jgi:hypothetical protein